MSEPGLLQSAPAAIPGESLWQKAPAWRNLIVGASALTLAALALPLILPQPADTAQTLTAAPIQDVTVTPMIALPAESPPAVSAVAPANPVRHAIRAPRHVASPPQQQAAPTVNLSNLPIGTEIVSSGLLARVGRHNRYNPSLGGDLPVSITIISPPAHGAISTHGGAATLTFPNAGITRVSSVTNIFYQSDHGYVGQDSFTYKRTSSDPNDPLNANTYTVNIYVK